MSRYIYFTKLKYLIFKKYLKTEGVVLLNNWAAALASSLLLVCNTIQNSVSHILVFMLREAIKDTISKLSQSANDAAGEAQHAKLDQAH
jgi:hypothetical protein